MACTQQAASRLSVKHCMFTYYFFGVHLVLCSAWLVNDSCTVGKAMLLARITAHVHTPACISVVLQAVLVCCRSTSSKLIAIVDRPTSLNLPSL